MQHTIVQSIVQKLSEPMCFYWRVGCCFSSLGAPADYFKPELPLNLIAHLPASIWCDHQAHRLIHLHRREGMF